MQKTVSCTFAFIVAAPDSQGTLSNGATVYMCMDKSYSLAWRWHARIEFVNDEHGDDVIARVVVPFEFQSSILFFEGFYGRGDHALYSFHLNWRYVSQRHGLHATVTSNSDRVGSQLKGDLQFHLSAEVAGARPPGGRDPNWEDREGGANESENEDNPEGNCDDRLGRLLAGLDVDVSGYSPDSYILKLACWVLYASLFFKLETMYKLHIVTS
jgi:hypothetical protein